MEVIKTKDKDNASFKNDHNQESFYLFTSAQNHSNNQV